METGEGTCLHVTSTRLPVRKCYRIVHACWLLWVEVDINNVRLSASMQVCICARQRCPNVAQVINAWTSSG